MTSIEILCITAAIVGMIYLFGRLNDEDHRGYGWGLLHYDGTNGNELLELAKSHRCSKVFMLGLHRMLRDVRCDLSKGDGDNV